MPSITDVYNQLVSTNGKLDQVNANLVQETLATNNVNAGVQAVNTTLVHGFANVAAGMQVVANEVYLGDQILLHLSQQTDAVLCVLEQISKQTCELVNQASRQTALQERMASDISAVRDLTERANPAAALERGRDEELRARMERCCPDEPVPPPCHHEPCDRPRPLTVKLEPPAVPKFDDGSPQQPR
ncbi:hypothetical protein GCM10023322_47940 [Rugosimonospora acidiphila]|uniref:Uncharacterized protein n=1 Tax=Rugosimonospora acidiphila TaxID=556531 RepID=A0ABP9S6I7_9ACTN